MYFNSIQFNLKNPPHPGHRCGFSAGDYEVTRTHTRLTHTQVPTWVHKPVTNTTKDNVQNWMFSAYNWIKSQQQQMCCSMSIRICPCLDCGVMFFNRSAFCMKSNASCIALSRAWMFSSHWTCVKKVWHPDEQQMSIFI